MEKEQILLDEAANPVDRANDLVRNALALDLGNAGRALPHHRDAILRVLVRLVEFDPVDFVAGWAYSSIRFLLLPGGVVLSAPKEAFDRGRDVDWPLLEPFRSLAAS